jgi:hypothetical protein
MQLTRVPRRGYMLRDLVASVIMLILISAILLPGCGKKEEGNPSATEEDKEKAKQLILEVRRKANRASTNNNLRQMAIAVHTAVGDYKRIPPSGTNVKTGNDEKELGGYGAKTGSLYYHLLPYVEQMPIYNSGEWNAYVAAYHAPSDPSNKGPSDKGQFKGTSFPFVAMVFDQGGNLLGKNLSWSMPDGTSNCIMFSTGAIQSNDLRDASAPNPVTCRISSTDLPQFRDWDPGKAKLELFQAYDADGIAVAMGDANTRWISPKVGAESWKAAMIPNDSMNPGKDF